MGGAVIFVITIASVVASLIYQFVLDPLGLDYLKTIVFILVIAALVQIVENVLKEMYGFPVQCIKVYSFH